QLGDVTEQHGPLRLGKVRECLAHQVQTNTDHTQAVHLVQLTAADLAVNHHHAAQLFRRLAQGVEQIQLPAEYVCVAVDAKNRRGKGIGHGSHLSNKARRQAFEPGHRAGKTSGAGRLAARRTLGNSRAVLQAAATGFRQAQRGDHRNAVGNTGVDSD
nr:hypothetical protein [Tanacetum cinerariifolium]